MNLFGKAKAVPTAKTSIEKLRETLDLLEKRERHLQKKIDNELKIAKENATKNRRAALMALKRKKTYEGQMEKIAGARLTIETQVMALENAQVNLEAMNAMRMGAHAMKNIHSGMTVDDVDDTMDEIREQMDVANEINEAIAQPVGFGAEFDEDELDAELADLAQSELDEQLVRGGPVGVRGQDQGQGHSIPIAGIAAATAPSVPTTLPSASNERESAEERELRELEADMAM